MTTEQMLEWFDLGGIGRSPARFDLTKLLNLNGQHLRETDDGALIEQMQRDLTHYKMGR